MDVVYAAPRSALGTGTWIVPVLLAVGCGNDLPWHAAAAEEARELNMLRDVEVIEMTREEFSAQAAAQAAQIDESYLSYYADSYGRLGYFDRDLDLRAVFARSSSDWMGAAYSLSNKQITLVGESSDQTIVHEYVHALQDQHFDLIGYDAHDTNDAFLARRAVVEGDAILAQYRFAMQEEGGELDGVDWAATMDSWRQFSADTLAEAEYPVVFLDYVSFVYAYGLEYVAANLMGVSRTEPEVDVPLPPDWGLQDALFQDRPPGSTQQVLQRDLGGTDIIPVMDIGLSSVPEGLAQRVSAVDWDTLGAWYIYLLFYALESDQRVADAGALAANWRGDRVLFTRDQRSGATGFVWGTTWTDENAAREVADAMWILHGATPADGTPEASHGTALDGELLWIARRGERLVVAKNLEPDVAQPLIDAAFGGQAAPAQRHLPPLGAVLDQLRSSAPSITWCNHIAHVQGIGWRLGL